MENSISNMRLPGMLVKKIYAEASARSDLFRGLVKPMGKQYATIYMRELLTPAAAKNMDHNEKAAAIQAGFTAFIKDDLPRLVAAISTIVSPNSKSAQ